MRCPKTFFPPLQVGAALWRFHPSGRKAGKRSFNLRHTSFKSFICFSTCRLKHSYNEFKWGPNSGFTDQAEVARLGARIKWQCTSSTAGGRWQYSLWGSRTTAWLRQRAMQLQANESHCSRDIQQQLEDEDMYSQIWAKIYRTLKTAAACW